MEIDKQGKFTLIYSDEEFAIVLNGNVYGPFKINKIDDYIDSLS
ncbi:MAG: hypothetical protein ABTA16_00195 [Niallia sp.]